MKVKIHKTLCRLDRNEIEESINELTEIVSNAKYLCHKCARVSKKKKHLCKPVKLESQK